MQGVLAIKLQDARAQLRVGQKILAQKAKVSPTTIVSCEKGNPVQLTTVYAILDALNGIRAERELPPLQKDDIEWEIRGE